jgi:tetratricopeptide (TPR) repeat protein
MVQNKDIFFEKHRPLIGRMSWLAGIFLAMLFFTSCGGEETPGNSSTTKDGKELRSQIVEGLKLTREKKYEEATTKVYELVNKDPKDAEALAVMSYIFLKSNRLKNAREMAERALAVDSYLSRPYIVLARSHYKVSGFDEALDLARKALVIDPEAFEAYQIIGEIYLRQGLTQDAVTVLKEAVRLAPENPELLNLLGSGYIKDKQYDQALSTLIALHELDANNPGAHFNLALVYAKMNKGRKAMRHIAKAEILYTQDDNKTWLSKTRDIRRVIARNYKLRPEDIN